MVACSLCGLRSDRDENVKCFALPSIRRRSVQEMKLSTKRRNLWLKRMDIEESKVKKYMAVCNRHFVSGSPSDFYDYKSIDWAPCINLYVDQEEPEPPEVIDQVEEETDLDLENTTDLEQELNLELQSQHVSTSFDFMDSSQSEQELNSELQMQPISVGADMTSKCDAMCMTDISGTWIDKIMNKGFISRGTMTEISHTDLENWNENELKATKHILEYLSKRCENLERNFIFDERYLKDNDKKVKFYTGLPNFDLLKRVFNIVSVPMEPDVRCSLTLFQEFFLVMMRLRLNLLEEDLAYRFQITQGTVSKIISKWLPVMAIRLKNFIAWPGREELIKSMPRKFRESYGDDVCVVIDCFEVFIDRPSALINGSATYSQYKHHNTVKFLLGMSPQGTISFISRAWAGRVSDKQITEDCGILYNLRHNDLVIADRGFKIADSVGFYCARLYMPAFTTGKPQLSEEEVEDTKKLANVRIHVERIIGLVRRKYRILRGILPVETLTVKKGEVNAPIDDIVTICCALANLCPSIVVCKNEEEKGSD